MKFKTLITNVLIVLFAFLSIQLSGQDRVFLENCLSPSVPSASGSTLCKENEEFVPDFVIGQHAGSVTFVSTLTNAVDYFGTDTYFSKKIQVHGRLILDEPLGLYSCILKMGVNAEIISLGDNHLFGRGTDFFACGNMWKGITGQHF